MYFLTYLYFLILTGMGLKLLYKPEGRLRVPYSKHDMMRCSGLEMLFVFLFATGLIGLMPVLALRLGMCELLCLIGIARSPNKTVFTFPMALFVVFLLWEIIGLYYTPMPSYGVRMLLKYVYPLLIALFASSVVRDPEIFMKASLAGRITAALSILCWMVPGLIMLVPGVWWNRAALATHYIVWCMFSLAMAYFSNQKMKNIWWAILFALPCFVWVFRTDIMGLAIALSAFFFVKYRLKAAPIIALIAILSVCSIFYIPAIKNKMYFRPDEVTLTDFLTGNVDENNINTSGRKLMWEDVENWFYKDHELIGSGTGRVQTYFYEEAEGWRRGGQVHNDFLVLKADNGLIGLGLYLLCYAAILLHCAKIYKKSRNPYVRMCALVAGSSLLGILVTMYSDNTLSYSMATLSFPWGFYGMALGLKRREDGKD